MADVLLTKRVEFAAAHRYHRDAWDERRNRTVFGACHNDPGHGHNYLLEVTVSGLVDERTGMVVNLNDLKRVLEQGLEEFDHKHLNRDTPYFRQLIPTTENFAGVLWDRLAAFPQIGRLVKVRLFEDEDLFAEVTSMRGLKQVSLTRQYHFSAAHRVQEGRRAATPAARRSGLCHSASVHGHTYALRITLVGDVDQETGMIVNIPRLDRLVQELVLQRVDQRDLNEDLDFSSRPPTGENLARLIFGLLHKSIPSGRLARVGLLQARDAYVEYSG